jgi:hypothetical protein
MNINILPNIDVSYLDECLLDQEKRLIVKPASFYQTIPQENLAIWCHHKGIYCLPTEELIDWLKPHLIPSKTIEVGAGVGTIGRSLGIPITDSCYMKNDSNVALYYKILGQPITCYPSDVLEMNSITAINHFQPEVIIGSWITHIYDKENPLNGGNQFGINEEEMLNKINKYIMIGNEFVHKNKPLLRFPHHVFKFPWLFSRSLKNDMNVIYLWEK